MSEAPSREVHPAKLSRRRTPARTVNTKATVSEETPVAVERKSGKSTSPSPSILRKALLIREVMDKLYPDPPIPLDHRVSQPGTQVAAIFISASLVSCNIVYSIICTASTSSCSTGNDKHPAVVLLQSPCWIRFSLACGRLRGQSPVHPTGRGTNQHESFAQFAMRTS